MPGWRQGSWGYHGDDGKILARNGSRGKYGPTYGTGDVVGCGGSKTSQTLFFTKNGQHLDDRSGGQWHPSQTLRRDRIGTKDVQVSVNFGSLPFRYMGKLAENTSLIVEGRKMVSERWKRNLKKPSSTSRFDGDIFIDADPELFRHIRNFLRRSVPPLFWTKANGFDYSLYNQVLREAEYYQIESLAQWIRQRKYLNSVTTSQSIRVVNIANCIGTGLSGSPANTEMAFSAND
ncbi:hypothetical protein QJS04_geneDACA024233 [Acorus gramineus]|uniref:B30.2/SPRY domain-containing protein n=1 Tax=Acorus gramineus TaxID=55184 RepID=A0AAV8ZX79_ACOGR|nr:hypothetical protein QJS04_geneDACA024233 [Acorus gramineus]